MRLPSRITSSAQGSSTWHLLQPFEAAGCSSSGIVPSFPRLMPAMSRLDFPRLAARTERLME